MTIAQPIPVPKSSAAGQYLGYSLQQARLCYYLLHVTDEEAVSIEYADDITVHRADGTFLLEQCKSALTGNPATDRSEDLWKTFANWADRCKEGIDAESSDFIYYITPLKAKNFVSEIHAAVSDETAAKVLKKIKKIMENEYHKNEWPQHIERFLNAGDEICIKIIKKFSFNNDKDPVEPIRILLRPTLPKETLENFIATAIGMARDMADRLISEREVAIVQAVEFRRRFHAFVRKHNLGGLLPSTPNPQQNAVARLMDTEPLFIRQLKAVNASEDLLKTAISDFLQTNADKTTWADAGLIDEASIDRLEQDLKRQHVLFRDEVEDTLENQEETRRGRTLYRKCTQITGHLEERPLPLRFIAGEYNCLADSRCVGWHPQYETLFPID